MIAPGWWLASTLAGHERLRDSQSAGGVNLWIWVTEQREFAAVILVVGLADWQTGRLADWQTSRLATGMRLTSLIFGRP